MMRQYRDFQNIAVPIIYVVIIINVRSIQNYVYHMIQYLFPVMMRGRAYGIANFVARTVSSTSTIFVEYTDHPLYFVIPFTFLVNMIINLLREVDFENGWIPGKGFKEPESENINCN